MEFVVKKKRNPAFKHALSLVQPSLLTVFDARNWYMVHNLHIQNKTAIKEHDRKQEADITEYISLQSKCNWEYLPQNELWSESLQLTYFLHKAMFYYSIMKLFVGKKTKQKKEKS